MGGVEQGRLAPHRRKAIGILEIGEPAVALGLPTGDNVVELARFELGKVVVIGHAAVENHGGSLFEANALTQAVEHDRKAGAILDVPGENLMRDRETVAIDHQPYHHLLAVGPVIARIAALGLAVLGSKSLEIGRGEIVKVDRGVEIEQAALARTGIHHGKDYCDMGVWIARERHVGGLVGAPHQVGIDLGPTLAPFALAGFRTLPFPCAAKLRDQPGLFVLRKRTCDLAHHLARWIAAVRQIITGCGEDAHAPPDQGKCQAPA